MSYLYGDSSPSPLQSNFIQFLGDALDFSVHALLAAGRMQRHADRIAALKSAADAEIERLEALGAIVNAAVADAPKGSAQSQTTGCAAALVAATAEIVGKYAVNVTTVLGGDVAAVEAADALERQGCHGALEALLRQHDPPGATASTRFVQEGARYAARRTVETTFGLEWTMEIDIPTSHPLSQVARLDKFLQTIEIQAPEAGGWLRKEVKNRPQRLEQYYLSELLITPSKTTLRLRANAEGGTPGFDIEIADEEPRVSAVRLGEGADAPTPFEVSEADGARLVALCDKIVASANEASNVRTRLIEATLDGAAFVDLPDPTELVDRLIAAMTPVVREIASHSLAPTELVLKRLLGDNRREEIFVSKAALGEKLGPLSEALQAKFSVLGLRARARHSVEIPKEEPSTDDVVVESSKVILAAGPSVAKAAEGRVDASPSVVVAR